MTDRKRNPFANVVVAVLLLAWATILLAPTLMREYYRLTDRQPWMLIGLTFDTEKGDDGWPIIVYKRDIYKAATGEWFSWVDAKAQDGDVSRICGGAGVHAYDPADSGIIQMDLSYFVGTTCRQRALQSFRVCSRYILHDDNGLQSRIGPVCTEFYQEKTHDDPKPAL